LFLHYSKDRRPTRIFASIGDSVRLPCGTSYINSCSSVTWSIVKDGFHNQLELSGKVKADGPNSGRASRLKVGHDCSLHIQTLEIDDGRVYTCEDGATSASVSLQLLNSMLPFMINLHCPSLYTLFLSECCHHYLHFFYQLLWQQTPIQHQRWISSSNAT
jgi:hypothetical protein